MRPFSAGVQASVVLLSFYFIPIWSTKLSICTEIHEHIRTKDQKDPLNPISILARPFLPIFFSPRAKRKKWNGSRNKGGRKAQEKRGERKASRFLSHFGDWRKRLRRFPSQKREGWRAQVLFSVLIHIPVFAQKTVKEEIWQWSKNWQSGLNDGMWKIFGSVWTIIITKECFLDFYSTKISSWECCRRDWKLFSTVLGKISHSS